MLNNKGFTVIEVVISFTFVVIILSSMFAIVINYQSEVSIQQVKSNLLVFKNNILEVVNDDIISSNMKNITTCGDMCININAKNTSYKLQVVNKNSVEYLDYCGTLYELPDSLNGLSRFDKFIYRFDDINKIYYVTIPINHAEIVNEDSHKYDIKILVSGKELNQ